MTVDVLSAIIWYAITASVLFAAWTIGRRIFPNESASQCAMHMLILFWSWLAIAACAIGAIGILNAATLGGSVMAIAAGTRWWFRSQSPWLPNSPPSLGTSEEPPFWNEFIWSVIWGGMAGLVAAVVVFHGIMDFPRNWDTLAYHRPMINLWIQTGSLHVLECPVWFAPGNNELLGLWWAVAFSGDFWVGLINIPGVIILSLGIHELGRLLELTSPWRHGAVIAATGTPIILEQLSSAKNDIAVAGLFVAALVYILRFARDRRRGDLWFAGLALGLLCGVKYYALGYAAVAWAVLTGLGWLKFGRRAALTISFGTALLILLLAAYWYGRNYAASGSVLFPMGYTGHLYPDPELRRDAWHSSLVGNGSIELWLEYIEIVRKRSGICQMLAVLSLPLSFGWFAAVGFMRPAWYSHASTYVLRMGLALVLLGAWLVFGITPLTVSESNSHTVEAHHVIRFSQAPLALSILAFSLVLSDVSRWMTTAAKKGEIPWPIVAVLPVLFIGTALVTLGTKVPAIAGSKGLIFIIMSIDGVGLALLLRLLLPSNGAVSHQSARRRVQSLAIAGMALFVVSTSTLSSWWHAEFANYYDRLFGTQLFSSLEKQDEEAPVIAALHTRYYPFFGSHRQIRVLRPQRFTSKEDLATWFAANRIAVVAVVRFAGSEVEFGSYVKHHEWLDKERETFQPLHIGGGFRLYRINRERLMSKSDDAGIDSDRR